ncbi:TVP38/TMEM64 family protein [bacterium]|nr:TVP38/TMEM64 family protein [bacterium]
MPEEDKSSKNILKFIALIFFVIAIILLFKYTPIRDYISATKLQQFIQSFGFWAPLVYIIIYTIGPILMFPGSILSLAGGLAFGPIWGTIYTVLGATIGACGAFWVARIMGRGLVEKLAKGKLKTFDDSVAEHGLKVMLFLRLVPVFPFNALNYAAGLSQMKFVDYLIGTLVGIIPGTFAYVYLGSSLTDILSWKFLSAVALFLVITVVITLIKRRKRKIAGVEEKE